MKLLHAENEFAGRASVVALGMFDGVHVGHQALIRTAVRLAREMGAESIVCTFDRHPMSVIRPECAPKPLLTLEENLKKFAQLGADAALVKPFTREFADVCPEDYLELLATGLKARALVVGENYTFGRGGRGNAEMVKQMAKKYGYRAKIVEPVSDAGGIISSTRIRAMLKNGEAAAAKALLDIREEESWAITSRSD